MKYWFLLIVCLTFFGCQEEPAPISKARQLRGTWQVAERFTILKSTGEDTVQHREFTAIFFDNNSGQFMSLLTTDFEWAIQDDPDRLMIAQPLSSSDPNATPLYFIAVYKIRKFEPSEIVLLREEIYEDDGIIITEERFWTLTK